MLEQMEDEELLDVFSANVRDEEKRQMLISETSDNKDNHSAYIVHIKEVSHDEADVSMDEPYAGICGITMEELLTQMSDDIDALAERTGGEWQGGGYRHNADRIP